MARFLCWLLGHQKVPRSIYGSPIGYIGNQDMWEWPGRWKWECLRSCGFRERWRPLVGQAVWRERQDG